MLPPWRQKLIFVCSTSNQRRHLKVFQVILILKRAEFWPREFDDVAAYANRDVDSDVVETVFGNAPNSEH